MQEGMNSGVYSGISAMRSAERRLEAITSNLANASTTAFKTRSTAANAFYIGNAEDQHIEVSTTLKTDFTQGPIERTGNPYDLALQGGDVPDFFVVEGPQGEAYTRDGSFRLDEQGVMQTVDGHMVAWAGPRQQIDPIGEQVTIDPTGTVFQGANRLGQLQVVSFDSFINLQNDGRGYYTADPALTRGERTGEVHQGALERSNVSSVDELIAMITVQRRFESASNLLKKIDESYQRLNNPR